MSIIKTCDNCCREIDETLYETVDYAEWCLDCIEENEYIQCDRCQRYGPSDCVANVGEILAGEGDMWLCDKCKDDTKLDYYDNGSDIGDDPLHD